MSELDRKPQEERFEDSEKTGAAPEKPIAIEDVAVTPVGGLRMSEAEAILV
jgi:hypothetical protein